MDFEKRGAPITELLSRMASVIEHRGPDDSGQYAAPGIGLGMRRLSIIDVAGGHQPIANEDETVWLVMNGEIYNFQKLRSDLEKKGHRFQSQADTEVIVHLYEDEGPGFFKFLRGMFGLALWDVKRERLILGRDRIGEKPLYIRREPNRLVFASELKSILQLDNVPRRLNLAALQEYLALGYVPAPLTLFEGIEKLLAGHFLIAEKGQTAIHKYWEVPIGEVEEHSEEEWLAQIRTKLLETVKMQLISDVPLGAFLSGGIDSSTIVALMAQLTGGAVKTYSIGYEGDQAYYNELPYAKVVAETFATDHHEIVVKPEVSDLLPKLIWHLDEPIADSACLTTFLVSRLARESVTVILSGVGGDELFGGYRRYLGESVQRWYRFVPGPVRRKLLPALFRRIPQDRTSAWKDYARYAAAFMKTADEDPAVRYMSYVTLLSPPAQDALLVSEAKSSSKGNGTAAVALLRYFAQCKTTDPLSRTIFVDLKTSLPDDLLALTDRMSMAASIECRAPLVDFELVEMASRMPSQFKVRGLNMKYLLKKAVAPWLPREIIDRKKRGFGAPIGGWLRKELRPLTLELLSEGQVRQRGLFQWPAIRQLITAHEEQRSDHTDHLFALIALELWCQAFLDGPQTCTQDKTDDAVRQHPVSITGLKGA
jgi:asparagine synthase (glutamine-hydrolysing)